MTFTRKSYRWLRNVIYTCGAAFVTWIVLGFAIASGFYYQTNGGYVYKIFPPFSIYTAIWIVSLLLPLTSTFYLVFDLRLRRNQIEDSARRGQLQWLYFPDSQTPLHDFSELLDQRFHATCQPWELILFSTIAGVIAFVGNVVISYNVFNGANWIYGYGSVDTGRMAILAAFLGSLGGAYVYIFNKFRTFDLYPSTYLQASIGFIVGSLGGVFVGSIYDNAVLEFLAFAVGFLIAVNVAFLSSLLRHEVARLTGLKLPDDVTGDLPAIIKNAGAIESLHNIAVYCVGELVKAEPLTIYLSLPAPLGVINGWMDEGLVFYYFGPDKVALLAASGVKRFTQLLEFAVEQWPGRGEGIDNIIWKKQIELLSNVVSDNVAIEPIVREQIRGIVLARIHNQLLGILSDRYRESVFLSPERLLRKR